MTSFLLLVFKSIGDGRVRRHCYASLCNAVISFQRFIVIYIVSREREPYHIWYISKQYQFIVLKQLLSFWALDTGRRGID